MRTRCAVLSYVHRTNCARPHDCRVRYHTERRTPCAEHDADSVVGALACWCDGHRGVGRTCCVSNACAVYGTMRAILLCMGQCVRPVECRHVLLCCCDTERRTSHPTYGCLYTERRIQRDVYRERRIQRDARAQAHVLLCCCDTERRTHCCNALLQVRMGDSVPDIYHHHTNGGMHQPRWW